MTRVKKFIVRTHARERQSLFVLTIAIKDVEANQTPTSLFLSSENQEPSPLISLNSQVIAW